MVMVKEEAMGIEIVRQDLREAEKEKVMETDLREEMAMKKNILMVNALSAAHRAIDSRKKLTNQRKDNTKSLSLNLK